MLSHYKTLRYCVTVYVHAHTCQNGMHTHWRSSIGCILSLISPSLISLLQYWSVSVIDVASDEIIENIFLPKPNGGSLPEPMYVNYNEALDAFWVGDRANNRVVAYDASSLSLVCIVPTGKGVFHMWADVEGNQLWVNNDIDKSITVISSPTCSVMTTIKLPADLTVGTGKPHDVIVSPTDKTAFVTFLGVEGPNDFVVKYDTRTFKELARKAVGRDPHVSLNDEDDFLYLPVQGSNQVVVLAQEDLSSVNNITVPNAHGAGMRSNGRYFYTTNILGGGKDGLVGIDIFGRGQFTVIDKVTTPFPTPHNIALTPNGRKIYVTHSGPTATQTTVYKVKRFRGRPKASFKETIITGRNPFGIAYVP
ncbi:hypothetical protein AAMO2058_000247500 [Amorphochlora amoebiformis]